MGSGCRENRASNRALTLDIWPPRRSPARAAFDAPEFACRGPEQSIASGGMPTCRAAAIGTLNAWERSADRGRVRVWRPIPFGSPPFASSTKRGSMTKYKLEYIWLDGYTPTPNLRGKTQIKEFDAFPTLEQLPLWGFDGSSTMQAEGHSSDCVLKPVAVYPGRRAHQRRAGDVRSHDARRQDAASDQQARHHPRRRRRLVRLRAGIFLLQGRPSARLPDRRLSGAAGPVLHRRRLQERRRRRPRDRRRSISTSASTPASTTKASTPKWPRASGNSRSSARAPRRAADQMWMARYLLLRLTEKYGVDIEFHCKPLGDTDWNGSGMHCQLLDQVSCAKSAARSTSRS